MKYIPLLLLGREPGGRGLVRAAGPLPGGGGAEGAEEEGGGAAQETVARWNTCQMEQLPDGTVARWNILEKLTIVADPA